MASDLCDCRGQCGHHEGRCKIMFGQAKLFEDGVDQPVPCRRGGARRLCGECATSYDPARASKERMRERALTEQATLWTRKWGAAR